MPFPGFSFECKQVIFHNYSRVILSERGVTFALFLP